MTTNPYDYILDCSQDFDPDIGVEGRVLTTGAYGWYAGITGLTLTLAATRISVAPIHGSLTRPSAERTGRPGWVHPATPFDVNDLQNYILPVYVNTIIFLTVLKAGEIVYEPFRCLVRRDRLGFI